jgi:hypothetical protein
MKDMAREKHHELTDPGSLEIQEFRVGRERKSEDPDLVTHSPLLLPLIRK